MTRLDQLLVDRGLYPSRSRARDAILRGVIRVDGAIVARPGARVAADAVLGAEDPARRYVSRAALKLVAGLEASGFDPAGRIALDIGASTGGFTQVLLERGAVHVHAVDVGHGQMAPELAADPRVTLHEGQNARDLEASHLGGDVPGFLVCDASFISLTKVLPAALELAQARACGIFLVKPQFEAGRAALGKSGIIRDEAVAQSAAEEVAAWLDGRAGWKVAGLWPSPIEGGDGNREFLLAAERRP